MTKSTLSIALTGHRPNKLGGYDNNSSMNQSISIKLSNFIQNQLKRVDEVTIISGMALGADTLWALVAIELQKKYADRIKLVCAIPCKDHSSKWFGQSVAIYNDILSRADEIHMVTNVPYTNSCMQERNIYMVDNCDLLVAIWDGTPGGTANCVRYANSVNKKIVRLQPKNLL